MAKMLRILLGVALVATILGLSEARDRKSDLATLKKLEEKDALLMEEDNIIDHGPVYKARDSASSSSTEDEATKMRRKKKMKKNRLGHRGEQHWQKKQKKYGHRGEHWASAENIGKNNANKQPRQDLDDARLQDVGYEPPMTSDQQIITARQAGEGDSVLKSKKKKGQGRIMKKAERKALRKKIKQALKKGLKPGKIYRQFGKDANLPKKFYNKFVKKYQSKKNRKVNKNKNNNRSNVP